jgi:hypothetical protein
MVPLTDEPSTLLQKRVSLLTTAAVRWLVMRSHAASTCPAVATLNCVIRTGVTDHGESQSVWTESKMGSARLTSSISSSLYGTRTWKGPKSSVVTTSKFSCDDSIVLRGTVTAVGSMAP